MKVEDTEGNPVKSCHADVPQRAGRSAADPARGRDPWPAPPSAGIDPAGLSLLCDATATLARLDERLAATPPAVADGWRAQALIHEAAASARLNGDIVDARDLLLLEADALDRAPDPALGRAMLILQMLRSAARRSPRQLFTPLRLIAVTRLRLHRSPDLAAQWPAWLRDRVAEPDDIRLSLKQALRPDKVARWHSLPAIVAAAEIVTSWHESLAADRIGAAPGRALAAAWPARTGLTAGLLLLPAIGFLGHGAEYRPDQGRHWLRAFLEASRRAALWGLGQHRRLAAAHARLHAAAIPRRSTSRLPDLADLLVSNPALSSSRIAERLGMSGHGARLLLDRLHRQGLISELSGRGAYRLFGIA